MRQYVHLFEQGVSEYTEEMARKAFGNAQHKTNYTRYMSSRSKEEFLSQDLGEMIGAKIWQEWKMPFGWDESKTYLIYQANMQEREDAHTKQAHDEATARVYEIAYRLADENPDMTMIPHWKDRISDVVHGMASRFNAEDIKFFVHFSHMGLYPAMESDKLPGYRANCINISSRIKRIFPRQPNGDNWSRMEDIFNWVASPYTMRLIENRLDELEKTR